MLTNRERKLRDTLKARGLLAEHVQSDASFLFLVRPLTTPGIGVNGMDRRLETYLSNAIKKVGFSKAVKGIMLSPMILDPALSILPNTITFKRKSLDLYVSHNISFAEWCRADDFGRIGIFCTGTRNAVLDIPQKYISLNENALLVELIDQASSFLKEGHLS